MKKRIFDLTGIVLILGTWVLCWLFVMQYGVFGSKVDWISQHSVIPDYFRQRFYATGDLFPDIAWNLGGGQNIYNFSYYGLFSPVILLSYLLPFVEMDHYIMLTSILSFSASSFLFYQWLKRNLSDRVLSRAAAVLFTLATPLLYHSYNQLMFVNYMPFLCLALLGVDAYCQKRKKGLLIAGVCGMILTSFYFSIGGMAAIMLYVLTKFERRENWKKTGVKMFQRGTRTAGVLFLCVCICGESCWFLPLWCCPPEGSQEEAGFRVYPGRLCLLCGCFTALMEWGCLLLALWRFWGIFFREAGDRTACFLWAW